MLCITEFSPENDAKATYMPDYEVTNDKRAETPTKYFMSTRTRSDPGERAKAAQDFIFQHKEDSSWHQASCAVRLEV